jgi:hypothetical protein
MSSVYSGVWLARRRWPSPLGPFGLRPRAGETSSMAHGVGGAARFRQQPVMRWAAAVARGRRWRMGLIWRVQGRRGSLEQGVPWWCKPSGGERQWWHGGAAEATGMGVEGGDGGLGEGPKQRFTVAQRRQAQLRWSGGGGRKGLLQRWGCSLYSRQRRLAMAARVAAEGDDALKLWAR